MRFWLIMAYLFCIGSCFGWVLELLYRNLKKRNKPWINPGFCSGPYLPIYGFGLCVLYLLASLEQYGMIQSPFWNRAVLFGSMAIGMTVIEYIAGVFCVKFLKVRLWDYSNEWGNIQGIICPVFSAAWAVLGALYYFLIHPRILSGLEWLSQNLAFSFFIGVFFGIFLVDAVNSGHVIVKLKRFAEENKVVLAYEGLKAQIRELHEKAAAKYHFFTPFPSEHILREHLKDIAEHLEQQRKHRT